MAKNADGKVVVAVEADTKTFEKQIDEVEGRLEEIDTMLSHPKEFGLTDADIAKLNVEAERLNNKLWELKKRQTDLNKTDFSQLTKGLKNAVKSVGRWALALFGIRSAYMAIRTALNGVSQHNQDVANTIMYAKQMVSTALEPAIIKIVDWLKIALSYINQLFKVWFKRDLFAETNKNLQKANKSASALKKTLAGFDEMNILNTDSSGGGGGISNSDLGLPNTEATGAFKWIIDNKDATIAAIAAIAGALIALKLSGFDPIVGILGGILGLGIFEFVSGILQMIENPSWSAFGTIMEGLGIIITSIALILMKIEGASGPIGWIMIAVGTLIGLIGALTIELNKNRDGIKSVEEATNDLNDAKLALADETANYTRAVKDEEEAQRKLADIMKKTGIDAEELYNQVADGTLKYKDLSEEQRTVYDAYVNLLQAQGRVEATSKKLDEAKKNEIKSSIEMELANAKQEGSYEKLKKKVIEAYNSGKISAKEASDYISRAMANMDYEAMKVFSKNIPDSIRKGLNPYKYKTDMERIKAWWNGEIGKFNREIKIKFQASGNIVWNSWNSSGKMYAKGGIYYPKMPRLAVGGLINQPGRGIPYHGAVIGEKGTEGILPLTDSQQMMMLGEAIGKFVNINATIPVYVGNRMIVREIKRISAEDDFASNR